MVEVMLVVARLRKAEVKKMAWLDAVKFGSEAMRDIANGGGD
jgi:hypothetical protein